MASYLELHCKLQIDQLNQLLKEHFTDIEINEQLTIHQLQMHGENQILTFLATVSGVYDGDVQISCIPVWIKDERRMQLEQLDIQLISKSLFAKGANWMANNLMAKTIDKKFEEALNLQLTQYLEMAIQQMANFPLPVGGAIQARDPEFDVKNIRVENDALNFEILIEAETSIILE